MKYIPGKAVYQNELNCVYNCKKAFKRIGEIDPFHVGRHTIKVTHYSIIAQRTGLNERQLIQRGILNVFKYMNHGQTKCAKYTKSMIKSVIEISRSKMADLVYYKIKASKEFIKIIEATYGVLYKCDPQYCNQLLSIEVPEEYTGKGANKNIVLKTIAPVQTNVYCRSYSDYIIQYQLFYDLVRKEAMHHGFSK